jgi:hypothetical protein
VKCTGANGTTIRRIAMIRAITAVNIRAVAVADVVVAAAVAVVVAVATAAAGVKVVARAVAAVKGARRRFIRRTTAAPLM